MFIATIVLSLTLTSALVPDGTIKGPLTEPLEMSQIVNYVTEDGKSTSDTVTVRGQEVQVTTSDGMTGVIDYKQGMLTMRPADEKACVSILLGDLKAKLPSLADAQTTMRTEHAKQSGSQRTRCFYYGYWQRVVLMVAPVDRIELQLDKAGTTARVSLSPLSARLCGGQAPMVLTPIPVGVKPVGLWWGWWPWHWWPRRCPWCWKWPCFYWPWWFYYYKFLIIIVPW